MNFVALRTLTGDCAGNPVARTAERSCHEFTDEKATGEIVEASL
jgi:hypothetical protein